MAAAVNSCPSLSAFDFIFTNTSLRVDFLSVQLFIVSLCARGVAGAGARCVLFDALCREVRSALALMILR